MEKIWFKNYPKGNLKEINPDIFPSLNDMFLATVHEFPDRPAVSNLGTTYTYAQINKKIENFAAFLQQKLSLKKGDRFALMMPNILQYYIAIFAAFRVGLIIVNVNPLYTKRELAYQVMDAQVKGILVLENFAKTVSEAVKDYPIEHIIITQLGDEFAWPKSSVVNFVVKKIKKMVPNYSLPEFVWYKRAMNEGKKLTVSPVVITGSDLAFLQYTGGTTGIPKGAMLTHRNMIANTEQAYQWMIEKLNQGQEIVITPLPLYHIFSLLANCLVFTRAASLNVLITNPRDVKSFARELKRFPFTAITAVNTLFNAMVNLPVFSKVNFSNMKVALGGGMAVHPAVAEKWQKLTGHPICEAYGLTETSPAVTINPPSVSNFNGSIGLPIASTDVKIIDDEGRELPINQAGELCIKGPQVMQGYWNRADETRQVLSDEGWLKTGDIAKIDEGGFVYIVDRKKDMVDVSGFNVYPNEIEEILTKHPGILEAAVIGVPSSSTGEALKAYIVRKDPNLTEVEIKAFCKQYLTGYKVPKLYEFRDELPKSNVGKILRMKLREEVIDGKDLAK